MNLSEDELLVILEGIDLLWNSDSCVFREYNIKYKDLYEKVDSERRKKKDNK